MTDLSNLPEWERVGENVWRFPVPGGWLYTIFNSEGQLVFVPDPAAAITGGWSSGHEA
jgi:hypothetical protein